VGHWVCLWIKIPWEICVYQKLFSDGISNDKGNAESFVFGEKTITFSSGTGNVRWRGNARGTRLAIFCRGSASPIRSCEYKTEQQDFEHAASGMSRI